MEFVKPQCYGCPHPFRPLRLFAGLTGTECPSTRCWKLLPILRGWGENRELESVAILHQVCGMSMADCQSGKAFRVAIREQLQSCAQVLQNFYSFSNTRVQCLRTSRIVVHGCLKEAGILPSHKSSASC